MGAGSHRRSPLWWLRIAPRMAAVLVVVLVSLAACSDSDEGADAERRERADEPAASQADEETDGFSDNVSNGSDEDAEGEGPLPGDHWHASYHLVACGDALALPTDAPTQLGSGIHTHGTAPGSFDGDGLVHIHPFEDSVAGANATLGKFLDTVGIVVADDLLLVPVGPEREAASFDEDDGCAEGPAEVRVAVWHDATTANDNPPDEILDSDFGDLHFDRDGMAFTLFFGPPDAEIPAPPHAADHPLGVTA